MNVIAEQGRVPIKSWTDGVEFEVEAQQQCRNLASMPFVFKHVAVMPDVHFGLGATVGTVFATKRAIIPAAVGVDIGCGMIAQRLTLKAEDLPLGLEHVREAIERAVPVGTPSKGTRPDQGSWHDTPPDVLKAYLAGHSRLETILKKHPKIDARSTGAAAPAQMGTLGGGNHFIEVCLDEAGDVWVMLHSGSRGIGNKIGSYFTELARQDMRQWMINLPDKDLAYLPQGTEHFADYVEAVEWAQDYAAANRNVMLANVMEALRPFVPPFEPAENAVACHHNYVTLEHHFGENVYVTRKGAVRAREGDLGIVPGSMGTRSYIVRGKGNPESFMSCSHGAGRRMSRGEAKRRFTPLDHIVATEGVECRKDSGVIDETPGAYKDIDAVIEAERDLVDVVHTLKQVLCVKG